MATATVTELSTTRDVRAILREFVREFISESAASGEVLTQEAIALAETQFVHDDEFAEAAVRDAIRAIIPALLREQVKRDPKWLETERGAISGKKLEKTAKERLAQMFESVGPGHYKSLIQLRRPEIAAVLEERKTRVATELRHIEGLTAIHKLLPDDDTPVGNLRGHTLQRILTEYFEPGE
jgi:hypothetical protein